MLINCLAALFGIVVHILAKLAGLEEAQKSFKVQVWISKNKWRTLYSLVTAIGMVFLLGDTEWMDSFSAFFVGYSTDSFMKNVIGEKGVNNPFKAKKNGTV